MTQACADIHALQFKSSKWFFDALHVTASCPVKVLPSVDSSTCQPDELDFHYFTDAPKGGHFTQDKGARRLILNQYQHARAENNDALLIYVPEGLPLHLTMMGPLAKLTCETTGKTVIDLDEGVPASWIKARNLILTSRSLSPLSLTITDNGPLDIYYNGQGFIAAKFSSINNNVRINCPVDAQPKMTVVDVSQASLDIPMKAGENKILPHSGIRSFVLS